MSKHPNRDTKGRQINPPAYYTVVVRGKKIECLDIVEALGMDKDHYKASAFAYLFRSDHKHDELSDLRKCVVFLTRRIRKLERQQNERTSIREDGERRRTTDVPVPVRQKVRRTRGHSLPAARRVVGRKVHD